MLFESALGNWDLSIYDGLSMGKIYGEIYHLVVLLMNLILLLNLIIAILSTTFSTLEPKSLALYYDGVIEAMPQYQYDKFYGALICSFPPVNLLICPFMFCFTYSKNEYFLRRLNRTLLHIVYFPVALIIYAIFLPLSTLLIPFAYLFSLFQKGRRLLIDKKTDKGKLLLDLVIYLFAGLPLLIVALFTDSFYFFKHLYALEPEKLSQYNQP